MSINEGDYDLHKNGTSDSVRHKEKLKDAFKERLHEVISEESIITESGGKKVKVPIKSLDSYRFIYDPTKQQHVGQGDGNTEEGQILGHEDEQKDGSGKAGDEDGEEYYEAEIDLDELIDMMLEDLSLPRLDPKKKADMTATDIKYDDVRKKGVFSNLDKKRSLYENIKRNAGKGVNKVGNINQDDLRFRTWREYNKPITSAAVICCMDTSGSMTKNKKYLARSFFFWMVGFLRHKYERVCVEFVSHTTEARVCTEEEFFHKGESGGTRCSSAYELSTWLIDTKYPPDQYNVFVFHFSDGDTYGDEEQCKNLVEKLCALCNMVGYAEINESKGSWTSLYDRMKDIPQPNFVAAKIADKSDIWKTLKAFFSEDFDGQEGN